MKKIKLSQGKFALADDEDFRELSKYKWHVRTGRTTLYAERYSPVREGGGQQVMMHRQIMSPPREMQIDHINHNGLDNRRRNLRICTNTENQQNSLPRKSSSSSSQYKGVHRGRGERKWTARIRTKVRQERIGTFLSEIDAAKAYDKAAKRLQGEFAYLNFPETDDTGDK